LHPEVDQFLFYSHMFLQVENRSSYFIFEKLRRVSGLQLGARQDVGRIPGSLSQFSGIASSADRHEKLFVLAANLFCANEASHSFFYVFLSLKNTDVAGLILNPQYVRKNILNRADTCIAGRLRHEGVGVRFGRQCIRRKTKSNLCERIRSKELSGQDGLRPGFPELGMWLLLIEVRRIEGG